MNRKVDCRRTRPTAAGGGVVRKAVDDANENHTTDDIKVVSSIRRPVPEVKSLPNNVEFLWILSDPAALDRVSGCNPGRLGGLDV
jgi:hypothetical protein